MSSIAVAGDTSGVVTISAPAVAGTPTLTLPTTSGTIITTASSTGLDASVISSGTMATARLASGSATSSTYLRGDQTWATISSGATTLKYVTDSTDINITAQAPASYTSLGSTFSASIPTNGFVRLATISGKFLNVAADWCAPVYGLRISSTNYWFGDVNTNTTHQYNPVGMGPNTNAGQFWISIGGRTGAYTGGYSFDQILDVVASGLPTGTQTIQLIVGASNILTPSPNWTIKGTTNTTRVGIEFVSAS